VTDDDEPLEAARRAAKAESAAVSTDPVVDDQPRSTNILSP
jgi:hypothetical protein